MGEGLRAREAQGETRRDVRADGALAGASRRAGIAASGRIVRSPGRADLALVGAARFDRVDGAWRPVRVLGSPIRAGGQPKRSCDALREPCHPRVLWRLV